MLGTKCSAVVVNAAPKALRGTMRKGGLWRLCPNYGPVGHRHGKRGAGCGNSARPVLRGRGRARETRHDGQAPRLPFTYSRPKRNSLRTAKPRDRVLPPQVRQKISGTFHSVQGAEIFCRIRRDISILKKQGMPVFEYIQNVFQGDAFIPKRLHNAVSHKFLIQAPTEQLLVPFLTMPTILSRPQGYCRICVSLLIPALRHRFRILIAPIPH